MQDLIERLKKLTGPDREIDVEIGRIQNVLVMQRDRETGWNRPYTHHRYTESLDSALTLLPLEPKNEPSGTWDWQIESTNGGLTISARVGDVRAFADTPAIALCIAALKARVPATHEN